MRRSLIRRGRVFSWCDRQPLLRLRTIASSRLQMPRWPPSLRIASPWNALKCLQVWQLVQVAFIVRVFGVGLGCALPMRLRRET